MSSTDTCPDCGQDAPRITYIHHDGAQPDGVCKMCGQHHFDLPRQMVHDILRELTKVVGDSGKSEGAVEVVQRLVAEHIAARGTPPPLGDPARSAYYQARMNAAWLDWSGAQKARAQADEAYCKAGGNLLGGHV